MGTEGKMSFMPKQPEPNMPAGYDPRTGRIYEEPWYDPSRDNPLGGLLKQLMTNQGQSGMTEQQAIPQLSSLKDLMTQIPDMPDIFMRYFKKQNDR